MLSSLDIKIELLKRGITGGQIAKRIGVSRAFVSMVINRRHKGMSRRVRTEIARTIGRTYTEVWGKHERKAA